MSAARKRKIVEPNIDEMWEQVDTARANRQKHEASIQSLARTLEILRDQGLASKAVEEIARGCLTREMNEWAQAASAFNEGFDYTDGVSMDLEPEGAEKIDTDAVFFSENDDRE